MRPAGEPATTIMDDFAILGGLFAIAFVAATILPAQSEAALIGLLAAGTRVMMVAMAIWMMVKLMAMGH